MQEEEEEEQEQEEKEEEVEGSRKSGECERGLAWGPKKRWCRERMA